MRLPGASPAGGKVLTGPLCDALDPAAPPVVLYEKTASLGVKRGMKIGVRLMEVAGHFELSEAAYPFARLAEPALMAELREQSEAHWLAADVYTTGASVPDARRRCGAWPAASGCRQGDDGTAAGVGLVTGFRTLQKPGHYPSPGLFIAAPG
jgi:hypothetical protein